MWRLLFFDRLSREQILPSQILCLNDTFHSKKRNVHSGVENLLSFNAPDVLMFDTIRYDGQISQATSEKKWDVKICRKRTAKKT